MAQIARLHIAQIANGNVINATDLSDEFNQLVTAHNDVDDRLDDIENNNVSLDGVKTFLSNPKMDGITEKTVGGGVAVDNLTLKDGSIIYPAATELTIASGAITVTQGIHSIDTEGDASTDDLVTISGVAARQRVILYAANNARTVVLKHGSGNIFTYNGEDVTLDDDNKRIEIIGDGTNVYVMGVTTAPTAADGASWVLLASATASTSAALTFDDYFTSTYDVYVLQCVSLVPATDGASFGIQFSISNSYQTSNYRWGTNDPTENATGNSGGSGQSFLGLAPATGNATGENANATAIIYNPLATNYKVVSVDGECISTTTTHIGRKGGGFYSGATTAFDGVRVLASTGNITSGAAYLYGVKKA